MISRRTRIFIKNDILLPGESLIRIRIRSKIGID